MRSWLLLGGLLSSLSLSLAVAGPTLEEQALAAALEGRYSAAIKLLETGMTLDPTLRQVAGRAALLHKDYPAAWRLFGGDTPGDIWGRIDVSLASGDAAAAAKAALEQMDKALAGEHREALGSLLLKQAKDLAAKEPARAAQVLEAILSLEVSPTLQRSAEDALLRLNLTAVSDSAWKVARARASTPDDYPARRVLGTRLAKQAPARAWVLLEPVVLAAPLEEALPAARILAGLGYPPALSLGALEKLGNRFPENLDCARLRLDTAKALASTPEGQKTLEALISHPTLGADALEGFARTAPSWSEARARWMQLASREGASARGTQARKAARDVLFLQLAQTPAGEARRTLAREALAQPELAGEPALLYAALEESPDRIKGLWGLAERFPSGKEWCEELGTLLLKGDVKGEVASRFSQLCAQGGGIEAQAIKALAQEQPGLHLLPTTGGVDVLAPTARGLQVSEHVVDPEALFRATTEHPLQVPLDAFLMTPDLSYEVATPEGTLAKLPLKPRSKAALVSLTVRAGDLRASSLVPTNPLEIQGILQGDSLAVAVLEGGKPASGARLLVQDGQGELKSHTTDGKGLLVVRGLKGTVRLMAQKGNAVGFLLPGEASEADPLPIAVSTLLRDRAIPAEGARRKVQAFATTSTGDLEGSLKLRSLTQSGVTLEETTITLQGGTASADLWLQGGGLLQTLRNDAVVHAQNVPTARDEVRDPFALSYTPLHPQPGDKLTLQLVDTDRPSPTPRQVSVTIETPWSTLTLPAGTMTHTLDLTPAAPGDEIRVIFQGGGPRWSSALRVASAESPRAPLPGGPAVVGKAAPLEVEDNAWLTASLMTQKAGPNHTPERSVWVAPGGSLVLDRPGSWLVQAWRDGQGSPAVPVQVLEAADLPEGNRKPAKATLWALVTSRVEEASLLSPGEAEPSGAPKGASALSLARGHARAFRQLALPGSLALPTPAVTEPTVTLRGELKRGSPARLELGSSLPAGTKVWAWLYDGSDMGSLPDRTLQPHPSPTPGTVALPWTPEARAGEAIASALLEEEDRLREQTVVQRMDLGNLGLGNEGFASETIGGISGYGSGAGGGGVSRMGRANGPMPRRPEAYARLSAFTSQALATLEAGQPGPWQVEVPAYVTRALLRVEVRLPDGRWGGLVRDLEVGGAPARPRPEPLKVALPETWDGTAQGLLNVAKRLRPNPRALVLSLLAAKESDASALLKTTDPGYGQRLDGLALAWRLGKVAAPAADSVLQGLEGLPDQRRTERVLAALALAPTDPERALATARRLLQEPALEPYVRARAALALWVAKEDKEALEALNGPVPAPQGDDPLPPELKADSLSLLAARAIISGKLEASLGQRLWTVARNEGADDDERALALAALSLSLGSPQRSLSSAELGGKLYLTVHPPLAMWKGKALPRGANCSENPWVPDPRQEVTSLPALRRFPLLVEVQASPLPTRVHCPESIDVRPDEAWLELPPSWSSTSVMCYLTAQAPGPLSLEATWHGPEGTVLARGAVQLTVTPPADASPEDPLSPDEQLALGLILTEEGDARGVALLQKILASSWLSRSAVGQASEALLLAARKGTDRKALVAAFEAYRERSASADLDLPLAAAVARAYAEVGQPSRAVAGAKVVMDARFQEELAAVKSVQQSGLGLVSLKLLQELLLRYPEVSSVVQARYLLPSMLLFEADQDGERMGYTRASLRHTAAAELSRFLIMHPDTPQAPEVAVLLLDALQTLRDPAREQALAGSLAQRYRSAPQAWQLSVSDARARFARGRYAEAEKILENLKKQEIDDGMEQIMLELGRVYEAQGKRAQALEAYSKLGEGEAAARQAWLERTDLTLETLTVLDTQAPLRLERDLRPGLEAKITAYQIALENLLLRDNGHLNPGNVRVDGLRPQAVALVKVDDSGDLPLPKLPPGAYLLTVTVAGKTERAVVLRSDLRLSVKADAGAPLVHLTDARGKAIGDAQLWYFDSSGPQGTARTDLLGSAFVAEGGAGLGVLAKAGSSYAFLAPTGEVERPQMQYASPEAAEPSQRPNRALLEKNRAAFDQLFEQDARQRVKANML